MLSRADPIPLRELLDRGLVSPEELLRGGIVFRPVGGRNRNLAVERHRGPSRFLKSRPPPPARGRIPQEAEAYRLLERYGLGHLAPRLAHDLTDDGLLVLDLAPDARNLADIGSLKAQIDPEVGRAVGAALGALRGIPVHEAGEGPSRPWPFRIDAPDDRTLAGLSGANLACLAILQEDGELPELLAALDAEWAPTCFTHGDVRLTNVVVSEPPGEPRRVLLIDWEFAGPGDPSWDAGCLLAEYVSLWLASIPILPTASDSELVALARIPIDELHPVIRAAWGGFRDAAPGVPDVLRCVRAAGGALAQSAFAIGQDAMSPGPQMLVRLQLATNVLRDPERAAVELLGLGRALAVAA